MIDHGDLRQAGTLIQWALRPDARPVLELEYRDLLDRYIGQLSFRMAVNEIASGLGLRPIGATAFGLILVPIEGSVFAMSLADYRPTGSADDRLIDGLIQVAILATVFPHARDLDEDVTVARHPIAIEDVEDTLRHLCGRLEEGARGRPDPSTADSAAGLYEAWRVYRGRMEARTMRNNRTSNKSTRGMIRRALEFLRSQGCFTHVLRNGRTLYRATYRYQLMAQASTALRVSEVVRSICGNESG